jgi:hypothetical protein
VPPNYFARATVKNRSYSLYCWRFRVLQKSWFLKLQRYRSIDGFGPTFAAARNFADAATAATDSA